MTEQILKLMAIAPGPQTDEELYDSLRRSGLRAEKYQVVEQLRRFQRDGFVRLEGIRWRLLKVPPNVSVTPNLRSQVSPVPTKTFSPDMSPNQKIAYVSPLANLQPVGRWGLFRRMCRYYMDCLLQDEAPQLRAYVDNEDDTWIAVREVPWARLTTGSGFAVSLEREQAPFQRNRVRRGAEECVYLGYPLVFVKLKETSGFVVPLFVQPMQADWSAGVLQLEPDGPIAVNGAWLEYRFRQRVEREAFLRAMNFLSDISEDDDESERPTLGLKNFAQLAQDAAHYLYDPERFAEHVDPFVLNRVTNWGKAEPGLYNVAILTLGPRLSYTRSLLRDLRDIVVKFSDEDLDSTALAQLFPHELPPTPSGSKVIQQDMPVPLAFVPDHLAQTRLLHPSQRAAVVNAMVEPASAVTGPPGTGKSEVVASMLLNQLLRGRPTLFASKNHQALEAVVPRLNGAVEGGDLIVQTASRDLAKRQNYLAKLQALLARPSRPDTTRGEEFQRRFREIFTRQIEGLADLQTLEQVREEYGKLNQQLDEVRKQLPLAVHLEESLANWPSDVTYERLETLIAELCIALLPPSNIFQRLWRSLRQRQVAARQRAAREPFLALPNPFPDRTLPDAVAPIDAWNDFLQVWQAWADAVRLTKLVHTCEQRIVQLPTAEEYDKRVEKTQRAIEETTREWMAWAAGGLPNLLTPTEREALANLRAGVQNWGPDRFARELRKHFPLILRAFPLWSASNLSARSALPLAPGLFELVVIDEASQCDIASVVPLLARSRRAVFAGDPMQLRHVSTLDVTIERALLQQHDLTDAGVQRFTYRVNSAFDLVDASPSIPDTARVRLDLHFRSHELIADYCNEAFYDKTLHVVTVTEQLNIPHGTKPGIYWTHVTGRLEPGPTGAWCADEIEAIRRELQILAAEDYRGTVGVVTPFRQQMIRLKDALETGAELPREFMERVRFLASTAHGFQGDERDLILFSLCAGPDLPDGPKIFLRENPNLFNVAVSRARAVLHVFGNRDWALGCGIPFIEKLARRTLPSEPRPIGPQRELYQSPWEKVLAKALQEAGIDAIPQYPIAGRFLDLATLNPRKIDIEVDGESVHRTAGGGRKDDDYWRDLQLQSLGWRVCRFWVYELRENLPGCIQKVVDLLSV
jgi:very-short-patch-repair endonuclease